jgi:hypothetical protein
MAAPPKLTARTATEVDAVYAYRALEFVAFV